jgi:D-glucosaminate-6-phosphate ammonia-lyase
MMNNIDIRHTLDLRHVINVSGTMTGLGASIVVAEAIQAMTSILPKFVEIDELQKRASRVIGRLCNAEAGFLTASCSAAITVTVAGAMTGSDLFAVEQLPDTTGLRNEVVIMTGHMVSYGAPVEQSIRLAGAKVVAVGQSTRALGYQLAGAITDRTAAAVYVVSHHTVQYGLLTLNEFAAICHSRGVPVIVDAASEYDLTGFLKDGGDLVLYSSHKFLGGPTGGIVAGRKDLVRAAYMQNNGIGRGMKVGKESIVGAIAALQAWEKRDHQGIREREQRALNLWQDKLSQRPGVRAEIVADTTGNPLDRLKVSINPEITNITAWDLADALARGVTPVIVRDHEVEHGFFYLDPCNLHPGQEEIVLKRFVEELDTAHLSREMIASSLQMRRGRRSAYLSAWPD